MAQGYGGIMVTFTPGQLDLVLEGIFMIGGVIGGIVTAIVIWLLRDKQPTTKE